VSEEIPVTGEDGRRLTIEAVRGDRIVDTLSGGRTIRRGVRRKRLKLRETGEEVVAVGEGLFMVTRTQERLTPVDPADEPDKIAGADALGG
jgi:hypothetical protein